MFDHRCIDHLPVDHEYPVPAGDRRQNPPGPVELFMAGHKGVMNQCNLTGVDAQQAAKTHIPGIGSHAGHAFAVLDVREYAVQRRRQMRQRAVKENGVARLVENPLLSVCAAGQAQIQAQIQCAERQALYPARLGNSWQLQ